MLSAPASAEGTTSVVSQSVPLGNASTVTALGKRTTEAESKSQLGRVSTGITAQSRDGAGMVAAPDARRAVYTIACIDDSPTV